MGFVVHSKWAALGVPGVDQCQGERTMLGMDDVDEELQRGFGLSINELEPLLRVGGDAAEMKFMECCRYLWQADGAELTEPFIEAVFNKLPEKSRCVLFQRMLTIVCTWHKMPMYRHRLQNEAAVVFCGVVWSPRVVRESELTKVIWPLNARLCL
jgi:hypothetical protein